MFSVRLTKRDWSTHTHRASLRWFTTWFSSVYAHFSTRRSHSHRVTLLRLPLSRASHYKLCVYLGYPTDRRARWASKKSDNYSSVKRICSQIVPLTFLAQIVAREEEIVGSLLRKEIGAERRATQRNATPPCLVSSYLGKSPTRLVGFEIFDSSISYCRRVILAWTRRGECAHAGTLSTCASRVSYSDSRIISAWRMNRIQ